MTGTAELADLHRGIEESAALLDVAVSRDSVQPILTAYEDVLPQALIAFRVATNANHDGEFDARFTIPKHVDPYLRARANGLITETGHPVETLLADIQQHCPIDSYGIDFGVVGGFRKFWVYFPGDQYQSLTKLAGLPSMPDSVAANLKFFADRGLDRVVDIVGIDFHSKTVNLYFADFDGKLRAPQAILDMHREVGLPDPSEQMLNFCAKAFGFYATLNWESSKIERIAFCVKTQDPLSLPARFGPKIEHFVTNMQYGINDPKMVYAAITASGEEYYKLQTYYRFRERSRLDLMPSADRTPAAT
jgi:hypothetical protein